MDDGELAAVPEFTERGQARRQPEHVVQRNQIRFTEGERAAQRGIRRIAVRNDRRKAVEAAAQQHEYEPAPVPDLREIDNGRPERRDAAEAHVRHETAAIHFHLH
jgi:hypothetical protein